MAPSFWQRKGYSIVPADDSARAVLTRLKEGDLLTCDAKRPRNIGRHKLYWAICNLIADSIGTVTPENISDILKIETGHCRIIKGQTDTWKVPLSISFAAMDDIAFAGFLDRVKVVITEQWFPRMGREIRDAVDEIINQERTPT